MTERLFRLLYLNSTVVTTEVSMQRHWSISRRNLNSTVVTTEEYASTCLHPFVANLNSTVVTTEAPPDSASA